MEGSTQLWCGLWTDEEPPCCLHADTWRKRPLQDFVHTSICLFILDLTKNKATPRKHFLPTLAVPLNLFLLSCNLSPYVKLHLTGVYFGPDYPTQPPAHRPAAVSHMKETEEQVLQRLLSVE